MWYGVLILLLVAVSALALYLGGKLVSISKGYEKLLGEYVELEESRDQYREMARDATVRCLTSNFYRFQFQRERDELLRERNDAYRNLEMVIEHKPPVPIGIPTKERKKR